MPILQHATIVGLAELEVLNARDTHPVLFVDALDSNLTAANFRSATPFLGWQVVEGQAALEHGAVLSMIFQVALLDPDVDDVVWADEVLGILAICRIWGGMEATKFKPPDPGQSWGMENEYFMRERHR